jgi:hypothetical protein
LLLGHHCFFPASKTVTNFQWPTQPSTHPSDKTSRRLTPIICIL